MTLEVSMGQIGLVAAQMQFKFLLTWDGDQDSAYTTVTNNLPLSQA